MKNLSIELSYHKCSILELQNFRKCNNIANMNHGANNIYEWFVITKYVGVQIRNSVYLAVHAQTNFISIVEVLVI